MKCVNIKPLDILGCFNYILNAPRMTNQCDSNKFRIRRYFISVCSVCEEDKIDFREQIVIFQLEMLTCNPLIYTRGYTGLTV